MPDVDDEDPVRCGVYIRTPQGRMECQGMVHVLDVGTDEDSGRIWGRAVCDVCQTEYKTWANPDFTNVTCIVNVRIPGGLVDQKGLP